MLYDAPRRTWNPCCALFESMGPHWEKLAFDERVSRAPHSLFLPTCLVSFHVLRFHAHLGPYHGESFFKGRTRTNPYVPEGSLATHVLLKAFSGPAIETDHHVMRVHVNPQLVQQHRPPVAHHRARAMLALRQRRTHRV